MAHLLDTRADGSKAMFSVGRTPWHDPSNATVIADAPDFETALALAGCDYEVMLRPLYTQRMIPGTGPDGPIEVPTYTKSNLGAAVVRLDRGTTLGVVGTGYACLQNRHAFEPLLPLLDSGRAFLETGGTLRGGADAWMLVRFDLDDPVIREAFAGRDGGPEVEPFGLITNNHSGRANALLMQTPIRVVCANTLGVATTGWQDRGDVIAVAHKGDARAKVVDAAEALFGTIIDRYRSIAEQYRALRARILEAEEFTRAVLDVAAPLPKDLLSLGTEHKTSRGYDLAYAWAIERRAAISTAWEAGKGHAGDHSA